MRIGLDLDGVCYNFERRARQLLEEHRGAEFPQGGSRNWNWIRDHVSREDWSWMWRQIDRLFGDPMSWYPSAPNVMRDLCFEHEVVIITQRPLRAKSTTQRSLREIDVEPAELYVLSHNVPKTTVPHCDIYVDDMPDNIFDFLTDTAAAPIFVPRRHWNKDMALSETERDRIYRYDDLKEVLEWARNVR